MTDVVKAWLSGEMPDVIFADWLEEHGSVGWAATLRQYRYGPEARRALLNLLKTDLPHLSVFLSSSLREDG